MNGARPIRRLAIANRGEAATRCVRAIKSLRVQEDGFLEAIALFTEPDRDAPFVRQADRALLLPSDDGAVAAYLDHDRLLAALEEVDADAVWPGWGFVSEDADFVERLREKGIAFLGPTPEAMRAVGDKIASKLLAERSEVPVTAWSGRELADAADAARHAERIGYPVVLKASAGGGGRGIRVVHEAGEVEAAFQSAQSEAESAFGDGRMFCEAMVVGGRHIEVQIAADLHGDVLSLGCRDCSVQRRHQKVLEEAPPPDLDPELRAKIEDAAVRIAQSVSYSGVGTIEFLLSGESFYFLEVNPRLQVEHGITEEVTGLDLVQLQIRIARGESIKAIAVQERGVAIEARLCAEDPDANFLPAPGLIARFEPSLGPRIRIDSGVGQGSTVPPDFDSLIAKVIATGDTREEAIARLSAALRDFEIVVEGGATSKGYLLELLASEDFRSGAVTTTWLDRWNETRAEAGDDDPSATQHALVAAAILAYQRGRRLARDYFYADTSAISAERIPPSEGQQIDLSFEGEGYRFKVYAVGAWRYRIHMDGRVVAATMREEGWHAARLIVDDRVHRVLYDATELGLRLEIDGSPRRFGWQTAGQVTAGSPAMVVSIDASVGERVESGQLLGFIEAMKMEIGFHAPVTGVVTEVLARKGQQVAAGEVLLVIDPSDEEEEAGVQRERLTLPSQIDSLAVFFHEDETGPLGVPDLSAADQTGRDDPATRSRAISTLREEIRRLLLGYDANLERGESLLAFLEAPLPEGLTREFLEELAKIRFALTIFADLEHLLVRAPRISASGELGPSNAALVRAFMRRVDEEGAGLDEDFVALVRKALAHYGVTALAQSDSLERALLRLLSTQFQPELRRRLVRGVIHRLTELAEAGIDLSRDGRLRTALAEVAQMRGLVSDGLADSALEAAYVIFEKPAVDRAAEQSSRDLEAWLAAAERSATVPSANVMLEIAAAARRVFNRVGLWISSSDPGQVGIALAAHVQRLYAPRVPSRHQALSIEGTGVHCVDYSEFGLVVAAAAAEAHDIAIVARRLCVAAQQIAESEGSDRVAAMELMVPGEIEADDAQLARELEPLLSSSGVSCRLTIAFLSETGDANHKTFSPVSGGFVLRREYYDVHPEAAQRIHIERLSAFELERIPSEEGIYSFYGRSRDGSGDERVFILADARNRRPTSGPELVHHLPAFERVFHRCTRALRVILQLRDPRRRLQWNRISISVAPAIYLDESLSGEIARRLAPATRHLGLEKVLVTLNLLNSAEPDAPPTPTEVVITDTGTRMEVSWRAPHLDPLEPAQEYERRVVAARRRRLVYPYEIVKMLCSEESAVGDDATGDFRMPGGSFEEFDLAETEDGVVTVSVAGRQPGLNEAAIVFGIISTPTQKVPEGMRRVLLLSDPTMGMGALSGAECDRIVAAIDLAEQLGLPVEWIPVSSGAKIAMDSGTENLDATARVVRRIVTFTEAAGVIHLIVQGVNVGAQSYFDALATMLMHTRGILIMTPRASMVLTGRAALEASGAVAAEDEVAIGGFERVMGPNGQAQYYARSLDEAYRILYDYYRFSYVVPGEPRPRRFASEDPVDRSVCVHPTSGTASGDFATVGEIFSDETNPGRKRAFAMREVMDAVVDQDGGRLERWYSMMAGETAIIWDAHLGGYPVSLIGIESQSVPREGYRPHDGPETWTGGTLFPHSSKKVARAINSASGNRPVVVLANLSGFDGSPESLRKLQLEYGAEIARAVVKFEGPILFLVVSRYHGGAYVVFSQELNESLTATALTGSYASVIGGGPAAAVVFAREVRARAVADARVEETQRKNRGLPKAEAREALDTVLKDVTLEKQAEIAEEFDATHSVERARAVGSLTRILDPAEMRSELIRDLSDALDGSPGEPLGSTPPNLDPHSSEE